MFSLNPFKFDPFDHKSSKKCKCGYEYHFKGIQERNGRENRRKAVWECGRCENHYEYYEDGDWVNYPYLYQELKEPVKSTHVLDSNLIISIDKSYITGQSMLWCIHIEDAHGSTRLLYKDTYTEVSIHKDADGEEGRIAILHFIPVEFSIIQIRFVDEHQIQKALAFCECIQGEVADFTEF